MWNRANNKLLASWSFVAILVANTPINLAWADNPPSDYGRQLLNVEQSLDMAWYNLDRSYQDSRRPEALAARAPLPERITNAEIMFLLNSYADASLLLSELLDDTKKNDPKNLPKVLYYLGESNFQIKNYSLAKRYFEELIELKNVSYAAEALMRLIQIGDTIGELSSVDKYVELLQQINNGREISLEVAYVFSKSLLRQNQPKRVIDILGRMDLNSLPGVKAHYFLAVALVMDKQYQESINTFKKVAASALEWSSNSKITAQEKQDLLEIIDLCHLACGRVFYELGDFTSAIDSYQNIAQNSAQFEQMLYDITWSYVRLAQMPNTTKEQAEANYRRALSMLDLLLASEDNSVLAAEARLLEGNLHLRLHDELEAQTKFEAISERYGKIIKRITDITASYESPKAYFQQVLATRKQGELGWENIMPSEVAIWAGEDNDVTVALDTIHEVDRSRQWIEEGMQLMDTMLEAIDTENRLQFLPELAEMQKQQSQMKATFINLSEQVANLQRELVLVQVSSDTKSALAKARKERLKLEEAYKQIPQNADAYDKRREFITQSIADSEKDSYKLGMEVTSMVQQLDAMEKWFNTNYDQLRLTEEEAKDIKQKVLSERKVIQELDQIQKDLNQRLNKDRTVMRFLNEEEQRDQLIRERYLQAVNYESELLKKANEDIITENNTKDVYGKIEQSLKDLPQDSTEWQNTYKRLVVMQYRSGKRLNQIKEDIQLLDKEIKDERDWANPHGQEVSSLEQWQSNYLDSLNKLESSNDKLKSLHTDMISDFDHLKSFVERLGKKPVTEADAEKILKKNTFPISNTINQYAASLLLQRIILMRTRIELGLMRLDVYMGRVKILVERQTMDIKEEILAQKRVFDDYKLGLKNLENESNDILSDASTKAFVKVKQRFNDVILKADVGLLDLIWDQKETRTKRITEKVEERNMQLELLRQEFDELSVEEE